jgi:hypothetical protein
MQYKNNPKRKAKIDKKIYQALEKHGNVAMACKEAGISRSTFYRWCGEWADFNETTDKAIRHGKEELNDRMQGRLIQLAEQGNIRAIIFHLSRRHPDYRHPHYELRRRDLLAAIRDHEVALAGVPLELRHDSNDMLKREFVVLRDPDEVWWDG